MKTETKLNFRANAKMEKLIGRELITNNVIAIFELIKNSYDAFAKNVTISFENFDVTLELLNNQKSKANVISKDSSRIIIKDDGIGMSFEDVQTKWMEIGTTSKDETFVRTYRTMSRVINGEKGLGRFGTDKIGSELQLISVSKDGLEKTNLTIDWNKFDDHSQEIQDVKFDCIVEHYDEPLQSGVTLIISNLRDKWTVSDIIKLKGQLGKLVSPFSQEKDLFNIYLNYNGIEEERVINDSFDFATTGIKADLNPKGELHYSIFTPIDMVEKTVQLEAYHFGPAKLEILYLDKAAKTAFTKKNGTSTKDYGNIKLFRDTFRVLPYGEKENDWLGIDNKHAQGAFRTFGTRDLIGFVQISKKDNPALKDATSRQGLNEDTVEFIEFKSFIWKCIELLQSYVFDSIKKDSEKQGNIIVEKVGEIKRDVNKWEIEIPEVYDNLKLSSEDREKVEKGTKELIGRVKENIEHVEKANKQLSNRVKVMEKIVGSENRLYDMLHAIKNRLSALDAIVDGVESEAKQRELTFNADAAKKTINDISNMVLAALRRSSPQRNRRDNIIISAFIREYISNNAPIYQDVEFQFDSSNTDRLFVNVTGLQITFDNLLDNAIKAMENNENKIIRIDITRDERSLRVLFEDNGKGISKDDEAFIFSISFTTTNGTGIGLSNVLDFMKNEGGDVNVKSKGKLGGAEFELVFPLRRKVL